MDTQHLIIQLTHSSVDEHLACFHPSTTVNNAAMNIGMSICLSLFQFFWIYTQKWNCWIIRNSMFTFLKNHRTIFHSGCTILQYYQQCLWVPMGFVCLFWIITILVNVKWYFIVFLICIFLTTTNFGHLFMYLLTIYLSSLKK